MKAYGIKYRYHVGYYPAREGYKRCSLKELFAMYPDMPQELKNSWEKDYNPDGSGKEVRFHKGNRYGVAQLYQSPKKAEGIAKREGYACVEIFEIELPE